MKRSYSDLDQHTGDPPFAFGPTARGPRQPKQYQQQTEPGTGKIKACMQCGTTRTPQWREGPYGPKTLCNACGVKRVRAIKAQQQGKNPGQVPHPTAGSSKKKTGASAAARTESIELATTLQLLAGNMEVGPPPAKRQARAGQLGTGRGRKANSMQAAANHVPEYDPFDPAAAAAMSAPALGSAVQKAIAAIAAKGSMGGESNPTDSGEEISWSPNDHTAPGDAAAAAAGEGAGNRRQRQQQQLRAAMAAAAQMQAAGEPEDLMHLAGLRGQQLTEAQQQHMEASLTESYGAAAADTGHDGAGAVDEEAAAVANLLSMSAATGDQQNCNGDPTSSAGKAAMREFVAQLAAGSSNPSNTAASRSPARRQSVRASPQRHAVNARQRGAAAAAAGAEVLVEEDVLFLLGPGMGVMARYVAPEELLEVIKLNELASEAQRSKAAAEAAVEAVEQILRDKQTAAAAAQAAARSAMQRLHSFVGELNAEHSLMLKAAQEQQPASLVSRLASSSAVGSSLTQLDLLAASLQQQQQMQELQQEPVAEMGQQQQHQSMEQHEHEDSFAGLAAAAVAAAGQAGVLAGALKAEVYEEGAEGIGAGQLVVEPLVVGKGVGAGAGAVGVMDAGAVDAVDAVAAAAAAAVAPAVDAAGLVVADAAPCKAVVQQHAAGPIAAQPEVAQSLELQMLQHAAAEAVAAQLAEAAAADDQMPLAADDVDLQDAQLLGSLQELAAIAGMVDYADNNGAAAVAGSPAML